MKFEAEVELIPKAEPGREPLRMPGYAGLASLGEAIRDPGVIFPWACCDRRRTAHFVIPRCLQRSRSFAKNKIIK